MNTRSTRLAVLSLITLTGLATGSPALSSDRLIIRLKDDTSGRIQTSEARRAQAADVMQANTRSTRWVRASDDSTHIFRFERNVSADDREAQLRRLRSDPRVRFAEFDRRVHANATSNDTFFQQQWALGTQSTGAARFSAAWDQYRGSASTVVAVVDSGILPNHPDLRGRLVPGFDFVSIAAIGNDGDGRDPDASDPGNWVDQSDLANNEFEDCTESGSSWHGTFVAGLIAGNTNDRVGTAGANWNARLLPVRALGKCGGYLSDVMDGARWAAGIPIPGIPANRNPAAIINLSLGGSGACTAYEQDAINQMVARQAVVVVAAGNRGGALDSPASCASVIAVGAVDADGLRASYSAVGASMTLMAPGGDLSPMTGPANNGRTVPQADGWASKVGTSFAAPMVSAALAMMHGIRGQISHTEAIDALRRSARSFPPAAGNPVCTASYGRGKCACTTSVCGAGLLDAATLVSQLRGAGLLANASLNTEASGNWLLDASASLAGTGRTVVSHQWSQISGPQNLTLSNTGIAGQMRVTPPQAAGDYVFRVTVQDSAGSSHQALVYRQVAVSESGTDNTNGSAPAPSTGNTGSTGTSRGGEDANAGNTNTGGGSTTGTGGGDGNPGNPLTGGGTTGGGGAWNAASLLLLLTGLAALRTASRKPAIQ